MRAFDEADNRTEFGDLQFAEDGAAVAHARVAGNCADVGVGLHRFDDIFQCAVVQHGIAVDTDDVFAARASCAVVHGGRFAAVFLVEDGDFIGLGFPAAQDGKRVVFAAVVDEDEFVIGVGQAQQVGNGRIKVVRFIETGYEYADHRCAAAEYRLAFAPFPKQEIQQSG